MEMKFKIEECPLQLWLAEYNKSISEYKEAKLSLIEAKGKLKKLTGFSRPDDEVNLDV